MKTAFSLLLTLGVFIVGKTQYTLDSTFNNNAVNEFIYTPGNVVNAKATAYGPDGSHYVAGRWLNSVGVWKYLADGTPDPQYGNSVFGPGYATADLGIQTFIDVVDMEVLANNKVLVLANAITSSANIDYNLSRIVLARFNADGTPDPTFNGVGFIYSRPLPDFEYTSYCLEVDKQGDTYYVGGHASEFGHYSCALGIGAWFIAAYSSDGSLKTAFNSSGVVQGTSSQLAQSTFSTVTPFAKVLDIRMLENGNLHAVGAFHALDYAYFSMHLNPSGTYENSYGINGRVANQNTQYNFPSNVSTSARILESHDFIIQAFSVYFNNTGNNSIPDTLIVEARKVTANGVAISNFGTNGLLSFSEYVNNVQMDIDKHGRLVYAWSDKNIPSGQTIKFRRFSPNGQQDLNFGNAGVLNTMPVANDTYLNQSTVRSIRFREDNLDMTVVLSRSATYAPNTFRIVNYATDSTGSVSSLNDPKENQLFTELFPNPTDGIIQFNAAQAGTFVVYSTSGIQLLSGSFMPGLQSISLAEIQTSSVLFIHRTDVNGSTTVQRIILK